MSRVQPTESGIEINRLIAKAKRLAAPVEAPVRGEDMVVVVMPSRDYDQIKAIRQAQKHLVTRPRKTPAQHLAETTRALRRYEKKYKMTSDEFYRRFQAGELEEQEDFFDWRVEYGSFSRMTKRIKDAKRQTA